MTSHRWNEDLRESLPDSFEQPSRIKRQLRLARSKLSSLLTAIRTGPFDALGIGVPAELIGSDGKWVERDETPEPQIPSGSRRDSLASPFFSGRPKKLATYRASRLRLAHGEPRRDPAVASRRPKITQAAPAYFDPAESLSDLFRSLHATHPLKRSAFSLDELFKEVLHQLWTEPRRYAGIEATHLSNYEMEASQRGRGGFLALFPGNEDVFPFVPFGRHGGVDTSIESHPEQSKSSKVIKRQVPTLAFLAATVVGRAYTRLTVNSETFVDQPMQQSDESDAMSDSSDEPRNPVRLEDFIDADDDRFYEILPVLTRSNVLLSHLVNILVLQTPIPALLGSFLKTCLSARFHYGAWVCLQRIVDLRRMAQAATGSDPTETPRSSRRRALEFWKWCYRASLECSRATEVMAMIMEASILGDLGDPTVVPMAFSVRLDRFMAWEGLGLQDALTFGCVAISTLLEHFDAAPGLDLAVVHISYIRLIEDCGRILAARLLGAPGICQLGENVVDFAERVSGSQSARLLAPNFVLLTCALALYVADAAELPYHGLMTGLMQVDVETAEPDLLFACFRSHPTTLHRLAVLIAERSGCFGLACRILQHLLDNNLVSDQQPLVDDLNVCDGKLRRRQAADRANRRWQFEPVVGIWVPISSPQTQFARTMAEPTSSESETDDLLSPSFRRKPRARRATGRAVADNSEDEIARFDRDATAASSVVYLDEIPDTSSDSEGESTDSNFGGTSSSSSLASSETSADSDGDEDEDEGDDDGNELVMDDAEGDTDVETERTGLGCQNSQAPPPHTPLGKLKNASRKDGVNTMSRRISKMAVESPTKRSRASSPDSSFASSESDDLPSSASKRKRSFSPVSESEGSDSDEDPLVGGSPIAGMMRKFIGGSGTFADMNVFVRTTRTQGKENVGPPKLNKGHAVATRGVKTQSRRPAPAVEADDSDLDPLLAM